MNNLNGMIFNIIQSHSKNKMMTFDFKLGIKEFCYSFNNKIAINDIAIQAFNPPIEIIVRTILNAVNKASITWKSAE